MSKAVTCLMLRTADNRTFFTKKINRPLVTEFAEVIGATIELVKVRGVRALGLGDLARKVCDGEATPGLFDYEVVGEEGSSRAEVIDRAHEITRYVEGELLGGRPVSPKGLASKFSGYNLSRSALSNHIARVRREIEGQGRKINRVGPGTYRTD